MQCEGKRAYNTVREAKVARRDKRMREYICRWCHRYHLASL